MLDLELGEVNNDKIFGRMPADNERFGATAAGRADLKGSAGMPPMRQAAIPLGASGGRHSDGEQLKTNSGNDYQEVVTRKLAQCS